MKRETSIDITRRLIAHVLADTTDLAAEPWAEPAANFLDADRWAREREQFFRNTPLVIGFAGELSEPGSFLTTDVLDVPVLVVRDKAGELRAFINACAHRGAQVATGCGKAARLVCGFHGWSYSLDGQLVGRGRREAFEPDVASTSLQQLPVSESAGLIVIGLRPEMGQLRVAHALDDIAGEIEDYGFDQMALVGNDRFDVAANWKLVVNLSHEGYHFQTLHRDSLGPMMTGHGVADEFGPHTRWSFPMRGIEALNEKSEGDWPALPPAATNHTFFPGTVVVASAGGAQMIRTEPGVSPGTSVVYMSSVGRVGGDDEANRGAYELGRNIFETEDLPAAEECQRGIEAAKRPVVAGRNEPVVQMWQRRWSEMLDY
ncbi:MAG: phenylpropionate dioxygenase-like ring-hydroxylating dioxygenase large terminal subunit [Myxococcota bacterium]|jgi:phenylpropionate dioxygenase-like ring-hydroxylating dioxygenase large terminal subunit